MMDDAAFHAQQPRVQQSIIEALEHARQLGLSEDEVSLLAWASGIETRKENHAMV